MLSRRGFFTALSGATIAPFVVALAPSQPIPQASWMLQQTDEEIFRGCYCTVNAYEYRCGNCQMSPDKYAFRLVRWAQQHSEWVATHYHV